MKSVLISIRPQWCELIANGEKTIEVRKTRPKLETPFKCYIYCTKNDDMLWVLNTISRREYCCSAVCAKVKDVEGASRGNGKVIGEFVCDKILDIFISCSDPDMKGLSFPCTGLTDREIMDYLGNGKTGYGWHISDLEIYDTPKELSEFSSYNCSVYWRDGYPMPTHEIKRPPQSWCYVKGGEGDGNEA